MCIFFVSPNLASAAKDGSAANTNSNKEPSTKLKTPSPAAKGFKIGNKRMINKSLLSEDARQKLAALKKKAAEDKISREAEAARQQAAFYHNSDIKDYADFAQQRNKKPPQGAPTSASQTTGLTEQRLREAQDNMKRAAQAAKAEKTQKLIDAARAAKAKKLAQAQRAAEETQARKVADAQRVAALQQLQQQQQAGEFPEVPGAEGPEGLPRKIKKKTKKKAPTYEYARLLAEGREVPGLTDRVRRVPAPSKKVPTQAYDAPDLDSEWDEIASQFQVPDQSQQQQQQAKKTSPGQTKKKNKIYHPDAMRSTKDILAEREREERQKQFDGQEGQDGKGLAGGALNTVGGVGQGALGTVDGLGKGALGTVGKVAGGGGPLGKVTDGAGKTLGGATRGVGNTLGATTGGVGKTLDDTTGALGRGDLLGGVGGATRGVGNTVGGIGKGLGDTVSGTVGGLGDTVGGPVGVSDSQSSCLVHRESNKY